MRDDAIKLQSKVIDFPRQSSYVVEDRDVQPEGSRQTLLSIPRWEIRWQYQYRQTPPVSLTSDTTLRRRFTYDNSDRRRNAGARTARRRARDEP